MKRLLLGAMALTLTAGAVSAQTTEGSYPKIGDITFKNNWIYSVKTENFVKPGTETRGMAVKDGEVLFCDRGADGNYIQVYDGATGAKKRTVKLPYEWWHQYTAEGEPALDADGNHKYWGLPANDIVTDSEGNLLIASLCTNMSESHFMIYKLDDISGETATGSLLIDEFLDEVGGVAYRFDAIGAYGDVTGDGYVLAPVAGQIEGVSNLVFKWDIANGTATMAEPIVITTFVPTSVTTAGAAPQVCPLDENSFYHDGWSTQPSLYDMDGNYLDGFVKFEGETEIYNDALAPKKTGHNGIDEFSIDDRHFVVYAATNTEDGDAPTSWYVCEMGPGQGFEGATLLYQFPQAGMGAQSNAPRVAVPSIEVEGNTAHIYVYGYANGFGAYDFTVEGGQGIANHQSSDVAVWEIAGKLMMSEVVASVEVFAVTGQQVLSASQVSSVELPSAQGVYVVKVVDNQGVRKVQKVVIK